MGNVEEILCGLDMAIDCKVPIWLSLIMKDETHILDNTPIQKVFKLIEPYQIECLMMNCNQMYTTFNSIQSLLTTGTVNGVYIQTLQLVTLIINILQ